MNLATDLRALRVGEEYVGEAAGHPFRLWLVSATPFAGAFTLVVRWEAGPIGTVRTTLPGMDSAVLPAALVRRFEEAAAAALRALFPPAA